MRSLPLRLVHLLILLLLLPAALPAQELKQSVKKQLFVFPVDWNSRDKELTRSRRAYFEHELMRELVFNFPRFAFYEMPTGAELDSFLTHANDYLLEHAQQIVQKRVDTGGRYGEAPITLDDLKQIVENGYAFVPEVTTAEFKAGAWKLEARIRIFRTSDQLKVGTVTGSTSSIHSVLGSLRGLEVLANMTEEEKKDPTQLAITEQWESRVDGVVSELRTNVRAMDEFSIKAIVTEPGVNWVTINRGGDLGVGLDERYKIWSASDLSAEGVQMLGYGKVRDVDEHEARVQMLIGGWNVTYADQVVEDARLGVNIMPAIGVLPVETAGFEPFRDGRADAPGEQDNRSYDLPEDNTASRFMLGVGLEYNTARLLGVSELYLGADASIVGIEHTFTGHVTFGLTKKLWLRRMALLTSLRYGMLVMNFSELAEATEMGDHDKVDDAFVHGLIASTGLEMLITPDWALQGVLGFAWFPTQTVLRENESDNAFTATVRMTGIFFRGSVLFTI